MNKKSILQLVLLVTLATLLAVGCAKKPAPPVEEEAPMVTKMPEQEVSGIQERELTEAEIREREAQARAAAEAAAREEAARTGIQRIFFDFDQYVLTSQARDILAGNAAYLKANPEVSVRIEGHCDERGSDEYNLALGERRAQSAQKYLISLGIDSSRLDVISYGEEKPLDPGNNEEAWAKNRRAEFVVTR
ncbi:peptidoglycan-associated lipoprotein Pal [Desulfuromonas sp. TF]|uniref:peptidoglycan-associated lipoprotein Pal n=1 Tax=Desulfuromonas sp. TF TaxID=1232410 RepID=UPI000408CB38|nr:peptidoglycan-associated lipoprotein Pal [Desulfuromonas sp. TF]